MAVAFQHLAVDREAFAGLDQNPVAQHQRVDADAFLTAIDQAHRVIRAQCLQGANGTGGLALGATFQVFTEQDQADDHRRGLEVQMRHLSGWCHGPLVQAQAVTGAGADGHQLIHVAGTGLQRLPGSAIKACAEDELHRCGEQELRPGRQHPVQAEGLDQHRQHQRQGQGDGRQQSQAFPLQTALRLIRGRAVVQQAGLVTGGGHRLQRLLRVETGEYLQARLLIGEIDGDLADAWQFAQGAFDTTDAAGAGHAFDAQLQRLAGHCITCVDDGGDQLRQAIGRCFDARLLAGQVDADTAYLRQLAQRALDTTGATGAGHALDRQVEGGHGSAPCSLMATGSTLTPWQGQAFSSVWARHAVAGHRCPWRCDSGALRRPAVPATDRRAG